MSRAADLDRIERAIHDAAEALKPFTPGDVAYEVKSDRGDPVTEADHAVNDVLLSALPRDGEGWLSEETVDDPSRLACRRVWVVDPVDGTREFVDGIPEWCISVGLVEEGEAVAGGIYNPATDELVMGALETGVTFNGVPARVEPREGLAGAVILASRSEVRRGEWERFGDATFSVEPCGSVAYKLGLVAAGRAGGTWTLVPKHEWDVVAGAALVRAAGGAVMHADGSPPSFNRERPKLPNLLAGPRPVLDELRTRWLAR